MGEAPTVVGINRSQDAAICVMAGPARVQSLQKERITRKKHHWGRLGDVKHLYLPRLRVLRQPVDLVVECYSSDSEMQHRAAYRAELAESLRFRDGVRVAGISHHLAHVYSAFPPPRSRTPRSSGRVVGLCQGPSESGPRALGHRSFLADPRHPGMQEFINRHVKGRELFRPLAPTVLAEAASRIFDVDRPAPFMQYAADVRPEHRAALPAITHVDGTARLQTVEEAQAPFLYALLKRFEARTGCPVLLNTSLNAKGDPLVETAAEALACFETTAMHAVVMPPYLVRKRVEPPVPSRASSRARLLLEGGEAEWRSPVAAAEPR